MRSMSSLKNVCSFSSVGEVRAGHGVYAVKEVCAEFEKGMQFVMYVQI